MGLEMEPCLEVVSFVFMLNSTENENQSPLILIVLLQVDLINGAYLTAYAFIRSS